MYPEFTGHPLRKDYPANRIQPLVAFREGTLGKLPPFGPDEGMASGDRPSRPASRRGRDEERSARWRR